MVSECGVGQTSKVARSIRSPVMSAGRLEELRERALGIGADPADSSDERFRKRLLVGIALLILPAGLLWGCRYWVVGEETVALTPWGYVAGSIVSLAIFARNRNFAFRERPSSC